MRRRSGRRRGLTLAGVIAACASVDGDASPRTPNLRPGARRPGVARAPGPTAAKAPRTTRDRGPRSAAPSGRRPHRTRRRAFPPSASASRTSSICRPSRTARSCLRANVVGVEQGASSGSTPSPRPRPRHRGARRDVRPAVGEPQRRCKPSSPSTARAIGARASSMGPRRSWSRTTHGAGRRAERSSSSSTAAAPRTPSTRSMVWA